MLRSILVLVLLLPCAELVAGVDDKIDAKLLIGKWGIDKLPSSLNVTVEFLKENKVIYVADALGKKEKLEGTYKVERDMLTFQIQTTRKVKIIKLTQKECILKVEEREDDELVLKKLQ